MDVLVTQKIEWAYKRALLDTGHYFASLVRQAIINKEWFDTGEILNSIFVRVSWDRVQVWSNAIQAVIMEFGRKPLSKRPPMQAIVPRLNRKWVVSGQTLDSLSSKDKGIVYVIAKSIGEKGIKPRKYFTDTFENNRELINNYFENRFKSYFK